MQMQTNLLKQTHYATRFYPPPFQLNPEAMKHFFIAQFFTIRTGSDDAYTEILTLEFNQQTMEDLTIDVLNDDTYDKTNDSVNREIQGIIVALKFYMRDHYGADSVNTIKTDQATIIENTKFQSTMLITYTNAALHIVHTYQY